MTNSRIIQAGAWAGFPESLRDVLYSIHHRDAEHSVSEAIEFLRNALNGECDTQSSVVDKVRWVDELFIGSLIDVSVYEDEWRERPSELYALIEIAERALVNAVGADGIEAIALLTGAAPCKNDVVFLAQRLNSCACVASAFAIDQQTFSNRLSAALEQAMANVRFAESSEGGRAMLMSDLAIPWATYSPGTRSLTEPLAVVAQAAHLLDSEYESKVLTAYKEFASFLKSEIEGGNRMLGGLLMDANLFIERLNEGGGSLEDGLSGLIDF